MSEVITENTGFQPASILNAPMVFDKVETTSKEKKAKPETDSFLKEKKAFEEKIVALERENAELKAARDGEVLAPREGYAFIYVSSKGIETFPKLNKETNQTVKWVQGSLNGEPFEVPCDRQVEVPLGIAEALRGLIGKPV